MALYRHPSSLRGAAARRGERQAEVWAFLNKILSLAVFLALAAVLGLWIYPEVVTRNRLASNLEEKKEDLSEEQVLRKQREREKFLLENDTEYIETLARDRLDLMKEGETIFRLDALPAHSPAPPPAP